MGSFANKGKLEVVLCPGWTRSNESGGMSNICCRCCCFWLGKRRGDSTRSRRSVGGSKEAEEVMVTLYDSKTKRK